MVIIFGHRGYGSVDMHGGQNARTRFFHIYYVPLFPVRSEWVIDDRHVLPIAPHARSIAAAYLRIWFPIVALAVFGIAQDAVSAAIAVAMLAAAAWSWTWSSLPRAEHRRSDFNLLAFGVRCDPRRLTAQHRMRSLDALKRRWEASPDKRPPEDVMRFGARSLDEAALAYGMLRLAAIDHGQDPALANRLLEGNYETAASDGPYRAADAPTPAAIAEQAEAMAGSIASQISRREPAHEPASFGKLVGAGALALIAAAGIALSWQAIPTPPQLGVDELAGHPELASYVGVHCDRVKFHNPVRAFGEVRNLYGCRLGDRVLYVLARDNYYEGGDDLVGELRSIDDGPFKTLDRQGSPEVLPVYLDLRRQKLLRGIAIFGFACAAASITLFVVSLRQLRRRG